MGYEHRNMAGTERRALFLLVGASTDRARSGRGAGALAPARHRPPAKKRAQAKFCAWAS